MEFAGDPFLLLVWDYSVTTVFPRIRKLIEFGSRVPDSPAEHRTVDRYLSFGEPLPVELMERVARIVSY